MLLPSTLTLLTLIIHRLRAAQAARQERAPEDVVNSLPWRVWTGTGWEKHEGCTPRSARLGSKTVSDHDLENGDPDSELEHYGTQPCFPSTSHHRREADEQSIAPPWFEAQTECAICLCEFVKGDRVRILPCKHFFHLDEIDEWLIHRKKLVSLFIIMTIICHFRLVHPVYCVAFVCSGVICLRECSFCRPFRIFVYLLFILTVSCMQN